MGSGRAWADGLDTARTPTAMDSFPYRSTMQVFVNGEAKDVPEDTTLRGLIEQVGLGKALCAAEVNKKAVPRREQESTTLKAGDAVEIVSLVGGG